MDNDTKLINLALDAGEIMLKNGAETFRVQDTMKRILSTTGREKSKQPPSPPPHRHPPARGKGPPFHDARCPHPLPSI